MKIEAIIKTQTEGVMEMKNLGIWTETTEACFTNRIPVMKKKISGIEDTEEEKAASVKKMLKQQQKKS